MTPFGVFISPLLLNYDSTRLLRILMIKLLLSDYILLYIPILRNDSNWSQLFVVSVNWSLKYLEKLTLYMYNTYTYIIYACTCMWHVSTHVHWLYVFLKILFTHVHVHVPEPIIWFLVTITSLDKLLFWPALLGVYVCTCMCVCV